MSSDPVTSSVSALPVLGGWCEDAREDPITGLVAFPDFDAEFPTCLARSLEFGESVGLAIGDVDNLKDYVERSNAADPSFFGHLAGNAFMTSMGRLASRWFARQDFIRGCASTFGGDEIIVAAATRDAAGFYASVERLRDLLAAELPRTVSFALAVLDSDAMPSVVAGPGWPRHLYTHLVATVDRELFRSKAARGPGDRDGFLALVEVPSLPGVGQ